MKRFAGIVLVLLAVASAWLFVSRVSEREAVVTAPPRSPTSAQHPAWLGPDAPESGRKLAAANDPSEAASRAGTPSAKPARIVGTITHAATGLPVASYELSTFGAGMATLTTSTDAQGNYRFEVTPGLRFVGAAAGDGTSWCERLELAPGDEQRVDRALGPRTDQCVRVWTIDRGETKPVAAARVVVVEALADGLGGVDAARELDAAGVWTDAEGGATASLMSRAPHVVYVSAPGYLPAVVELDLSLGLSSVPTMFDGCLHVVLTPDAGSAAGRVVDHAGNPVAGAVVFATPRASSPVASTFGEHGAEGFASRRAPFTLTAADGSFEVRLPQAAELELVALPRRADLVHHGVRTLDASDPGRGALEIRLPEAWPVELEFDDKQGAPIDGVASVRDGEGWLHFPPGPLSDYEFQRSHPGRFLPVQRGRLQLVLPAGVVSIGFSPNGMWREGETVNQIPPGPHVGPVRVRFP